MERGSKARRGGARGLAGVGGPRRVAAGLCVMAFALVVAAFVQRAVGAALANADVSSGDQAGYLRLALKVAAGRGFSNGNYHPLLPVALQPLVTRSWEFFSTAKVFAVGCGAAGIGLVFIAGWRLVGPAAALATAAALAWNGEYVARSARTEPDVLLTALFFAAWILWSARGVRRRTGRKAAAAAGAAGAVAGLAYLAKGTGQFLPLGFVGLALLRGGRRGLADRTLWLMVGLYAVAAAPLLVDNTRAFGQPFSDFASAHALWYAAWGDRYLSPGGTHASAVTYFRTHTPGQVADRVVNGLAQMPAMWRRAALPGVDTSREWLVVAAVAVLALAGAEAARRRSPPDLVIREAVVTYGALFVPTYLFFGWYLPVIASPRFELPLVPGAYLLAAALVGRGIVACPRQACPQRIDAAGQRDECGSVGPGGSHARLQGPRLARREVTEGEQPLEPAQHLGCRHLHLAEGRQLGGERGGEPVGELQGPVDQARVARIYLKVEIQVIDGKAEIGLPPPARGRVSETHLAAHDSLRGLVV